MRRWPRVVLAASSVALILGVVVLGVALGPGQGRVWLAVSGALAVLAGVQSVLAEPRDLTLALILSLPPVIALAADGSPTWLIGPLGVMLLVAGELNALSWDWRGPSTTTDVQRRRLVGVAPLAGLALAGALAVDAVAVVPAIGGTVAVGLAALALAKLGGVLFGE